MAATMPGTSSGVVFSQSQCDVLKANIARFKVDDLKTIMGIIREAKTGKKADLQNRCYNKIDAWFQQRRTTDLQNLNQFVEEQMRQGRATGRAPSLHSQTATAAYLNSQAASLAMQLLNPAYNPLASKMPPLSKHTQPFVKQEAEVDVTNFRFNKPWDMYINYIDTLRPNTKLGQRQAQFTFMVTDTILEAIRATPPPTEPITEIHLRTGFMTGNLKYQISCQVNKQQHFAITNDRPDTDITRFIVAGQNSVVMNYSLPGVNSNQLCAIGIFRAQVKQVAQVAQEIQARSMLPRDVGLQRLQRSFFSSSDVQALSAQISLTCPVSCVRMLVPVRGSECTHQACFDLETQLYLMRRSRSIKCPICGKKADAGSLVVDGFYAALLADPALAGCNEVEVMPDGTYKPAEKNERKRKSEPAPTHSLELSDEDEVGAPSPKRKRIAATPPPGQPGHALNGAAGAAGGGAGAMPELPLGFLGGSLGAESAYDESLRGDLFLQQLITGGTNAANAISLDD